jgi:hypothetical protein
MKKEKTAGSWQQAVGSEDKSFVLSFAFTCPVPAACCLLHFNV